MHQTCMCGTFILWNLHANWKRFSSRCSGLNTKPIQPEWKNCTSIFARCSGVESNDWHSLQASPGTSFTSTPRPQVAFSPSAAPTTARHTGRAVVPPLELSFKSSLSTRLQRTSPVTFRLLKDFVALPHAATMTPGAVSPCVC